MEFLLVKRAAKLLEEGLVLFFPVDESGLPNLENAYEAIKPRNPEDIALILHPRAFDPNIDDEDIPCDEDGERIFWSFGSLV